jgi:hypothetical protein
MDPTPWKQGNKLVHRSGPRGATGEVFAAVSAATPEKADYFLENVQVSPSQRRVIKLYTPDGALVGFAAFVLSETGGRTTVRYDVYSETLIPKADVARRTPVSIAEAEQTAREASIKRFDLELQALKKLVEAR